VYENRVLRKIFGPKREDNLEDLGIDKGIVLKRILQK
jgi:hypothetical protein